MSFPLGSSPLICPWRCWQLEGSGQGRLEVSCLIPNSFVFPPQKQLMVIGMDVYHCHNKGTRSVIGFVASMNEYVLPRGGGSFPGNAGGPHASMATTFPSEG